MKKILALLVIFIYSYSFSQDNNNVGEIRIVSKNNSSFNNSQEFRTIDNTILSPSSPTGTSSEVGVTRGELTVSLSGGAQYNIPINVVPGITGVEPSLSLTYNSQGGNDIAGYGWKMSGLSSITRIPSTKYHDGIIDGVNYDGLDRFALDGQRLILKNPNDQYGGDGVEYETENYSNLRIRSMGSRGGINNPSYFLVEYPDGSKAYYGNSSNSFSKSEWAINYWSNSNDISIIFYYNNAGNKLFPTLIEYGAKGNGIQINKIEFLYKNRTRNEIAFIGDSEIKVNKVLEQIIIKGKGVNYRVYKLEHSSTSLGYDRLTSITEMTGDLSKSLNPTIFNYENSEEIVEFNSISANINVSNVNLNNSATISGDFDGDGNIDIILYPTTGTDAKKKYWYFNDINTNNTNIGYEITTDPFIDIFPITNLSSDNKLMSNQGWSIVKRNIATNITSFNCFYSGITNPVIFQYARQFEFPKFSYGYFKYPCGTLNKTSRIVDPGDGGGGGEPVWTQIIKDIPKVYLNGDFNGDGLSDVIVVEKSVSYTVTDYCTTTNQTYPGGRTFFVNLDRRLTSNYVYFSGLILSSDSSKILVADFNGDGKSDLYVFDIGVIKIYTLNQDNTLVLLKSLTSTYIYPDPVLMGDYNGDGKADFIIPNGYGSTFSKFTSTGSTFNRTQHTFSFSYNESTTQGNISNIYHLLPYDYNADGKTDIIYVKNSTELASISPLRYDGKINTIFYKNTGDSFLTQMSSNSGLLSSIGGFALPAILNFDKSNSNYDLSFISKNSIFNFKSRNNNTKDVLLKSITLGNGVKQTITYDVLNSVCNNNPNCDLIYESMPYTENYPNFDIIIAKDVYLVSKIEEQSYSTYKKQLYKYFGAVTNFDGRGFLGFRAISKTNWFNDDNPIITTVSKFDMSKRGALSESYTILGLMTGNVINYSPTNFISKSNYEYVDQLMSNLVYKLKNTSIVHINGIEGTSVEKIIQYNSNNNPEQEIENLKLGSTTQKTTTTDIIYESVISSTNYVVDRPIQINTKLDDFVEIINSEKIFTYNPQNLVSKLKVKGNLTNYLIEDYDYDTWGNLIKKTISSQDITLQARELKYEYDTISNRFLVKSTDVDLNETLYDYNQNNGNLLSITLPSNSGYPLISNFTYDLWGNKIKQTEYLGSLISNENTFVTSWIDINNHGFISTSITSTDDSAEFVWYDDLGRQISTGVRTINQGGPFVPNVSWDSTEYDIYNRIVKKYEPSISLLPSSNGIYSTINYDDYGRIIEQVDFKGKTTSYQYNGLSTTINDGVKTIVTTKNAIGNVIFVEDNGELIEYRYYPDNNLKKTIYNGLETSVFQDGWGRKNKLIDQTSGTYEYLHNDFGELKKEITPNGTTEYDYDNAGKLIELRVNGNNTNSVATFSYNSAKLLSGILYTDNFNGGTFDQYNFSYDDYRRQYATTENRFGVFFQRVTLFDNFGRPHKEAYVSSSNGKTSTKWIKNIYRNGFLWQIKDDSNNNLLWETNVVNAKGQITSANYGNGIGITNLYDQYGYLTQSKHDKISGSNVMTLNTSFHRERGNLENRYNSLFNWTESFEYDLLDRLTEYTNASGQQVNQNYEDDGRIKSNNLGNYNYSPLDPLKKYRNSSIDITPEAEAYFKVKEGVFFDTMEKQTGWPNYNPSVFSFDTTFSNTVNGGITSLKIDNPDTTEKVINSEVWVPIDNAIPTNYTYSVNFYSDNPQAEIFLFMKKADGTIIVDQIQDNTTNQWKLLSKTFLVPADVKFLNIRLDNNGQGKIWFDNVKIKLTSNPDATALSTKLLQATYNSFKSPVEFFEPGNDRISFDYNVFQDRSVMYYGSLESDKYQRKYVKYYSGIGSMEVKRNTYTNDIEFITYIGGDAYSAPVVLKSDGTTEEFLYLHRDYLSSIVAITNQNGDVVEKRLFDAWGSLIKVQDKNGLILSKLSVLDRGYTGHEHLQGIGLIHMNGRVYDPIIHRFLQPDNYIQDISNPQNYNRYAYVLNNPLKYVDFSGETGTETGPGEGLNDGQQIGIGSLISSIAYGWDELGVKDFFNDNVSNGFKSGGNWLSNNLKSVNGWFDRNLRSIGRDLNNFLFGKEPEVKSVRMPQFNNVQNVNGWQNDGFKSNGFGVKLLDGLQTGLDLVGLVPGWGEIADGANSLIYLARGDYANASLSASAMIPLVGWGATGTKLAMKAEKAYSGYRAASSAKNAKLLNKHLNQLEKYGADGFKQLQNGSNRYYGNLDKARNPGEMIGRRVVREWNPYTGNTRTWMETLDNHGRIRIVRPETGGPKIHYMFDEFGNFIKKW